MNTVDVKNLPTEASKKENSEITETSIKVFVQSECYPYVKKWMEEMFGPEQARKRIKDVIAKGTIKSSDELDRLAGRMFLAEDELQARLKTEVIDRLDKYRS